MNTRRSPRSLLTKNKKMTGIAIGAAAILIMAAPALTAEAPKKDEVFKAPTAIAMPGKPLTSFYIGFVDPVLKKYFLADRDNKAIDIGDTTNNGIKQSAAEFGGIAWGVPNGGITRNNKESWAGEGDG